MITNKPRNDRQASILICVLVVMVVCGALSFQSSRMLGLALRNVETRTRIDQLQELLALGRLRLKQQLASQNDYAGESWEVALGVDLPTASVGAAGSSASSAAESTNKMNAKISIEPLPPRSETELQQWRVVASYVHPAWSSITATWESR